MMESDTQIQMVDGVAYRYSSSWIQTLEREQHWRLYWRQQKIMQDPVRPGHHVLEIGVGSGFAANYLRSKGIKVTTIDIDCEKKPDIQANIVSYDFPNFYDHILAFEVFEHLPFDKFKEVLIKIARICKGYVFLSVPRNERVWLHIECKLPKLRQFSLSLVTKKGRISKGDFHFWEVDDGKITKRRFEDTLRDTGLKIVAHEKAFSRLFYTLKSSFASS